MVNHDVWIVPLVQKPPLRPQWAKKAVFADAKTRRLGLRLPEAMGPFVSDRIFPDEERPDFVPFRFVGPHIDAAQFVVDRAFARTPFRRLGVPIPGGFVVAQVEIGRSKQRTRSEFPVRLA